MVEQKDPVLWGPEFSERGHAYQAIARGRHAIEVGVKDDFPGRIAEGKKAIRGQLKLVKRYPRLEVPWMEAMLFAFSKLPPEGDEERLVRDEAERRISGIRREEAQAIKTLEAIRGEVPVMLSLIDETIGNLMSARERGAEEKALEEEITGLEGKLAGLRAGKGKEAAGEEDPDSWNDVDTEMELERTIEEAEQGIGEKGAKLGGLASRAEAEWNGKMAQDESMLEGYKELLDEQMAEAAKFMDSMSAAVRRKAADVLIAARDVHSLINFCYAEMDPDAREAAFRGVAEAVRAEPDSKISVGIHLSRDERSMLLRMVEDGEPKVASLAWELAEWMLDNGKLDDEQMDFIEMQAKEAEGIEAAARVLSKRAKIWVAGACGGESEARVSSLVKVLEGMWSGLELDEEQRELILEFTEDCDQKVTGQAFILALELCKKGELTQEQMATLVKRADKIEDVEKRMKTLVALSGLIQPASLEDSGAEWLLAMAMTRHSEYAKRGENRALEIIKAKKASPEQVEMFVELVDSLDWNNGEKQRIFEAVRAAAGLGGLTENTIRRINVDRVSQLFLEVVQPGRPSRLPSRRSDPPRDVNCCAPGEAKKLKC